MFSKVSPKWKKRQVNGVEESVASLLWLNRILGVRVFEIPAHRPWPKLTIAYGLVRLVAYGTLLWCCLTYVKLRNNIAIISLVYNTMLCVNVVILIVSSTLALINRKKTKEFVKNIKLTDETLEIFGIDPRYELESKTNKRIVLLWSSIGFFLFIINLIIVYLHFGNVLHAAIKVTTFEIPQLMNPISELNFVMKISIIKRRFERLNALLQSAITPQFQLLNTMNFNKYKNIIKINQPQIDVKSNCYIKNRNNIELLLKVARQLHLDLCKTAREVNDTCSKQMSLQMASTFIILTGFGYCEYIVYNNPNMSPLEKIQAYSSLSIWIIAAVGRLIYVIRISVNVVAEAERTSQIAHEIQISGPPVKLIDEIQQLTLQIMQHPLTFTASGLVTLDFSFVRGLLGTVTTYLMILIQHQPEIIKAVNTVPELTLDNAKIKNYSIS